METRGDENQKKTKNADRARTKAAKSAKTNGAQRSSKTAGKTKTSAASVPAKAVKSAAKKPAKAASSKAAGTSGAKASAKPSAKARTTKKAVKPTSARAKTRVRKSDADAPKPIKLPKGYRPTEKETFMSPRQREYFRLRLLAWQEEILEESRETILHLQEHSPQQPDLADRASIETDRLIELRTRDRERKLMSKIDEALQRIEDGSYGYCEETGEPISLQRLEARPVATLSIDAQERHERMEKTYRDD